MPYDMLILSTFLHRVSVHMFTFFCAEHAWSARQVPRDSTEPNSQHMADDFLKLIHLIENVCILIQIQLQFVPKRLILNK